MRWAWEEFNHPDSLFALLVFLRSHHPSIYNSPALGSVFKSWPKSKTVIAYTARALLEAGWHTEEEQMSLRFRPEFPKPLPDAALVKLWRPARQSRSHSFVWGQPTIWLDLPNQRIVLQPRGIAGWPAYCFVEKSDSNNENDENDENNESKSENLEVAIEIVGSVETAETRVHFEISLDKFQKDYLRPVLKGTLIETCRDSSPKR